MNVKLLLQQQGLSVRQLAAELEVPLKTVQDWVYRAVVPSPANQPSAFSGFRNAFQRNPRVSGTLQDYPSTRV